MATSRDLFGPPKYSSPKDAADSGEVNASVSLRIGESFEQTSPTTGIISSGSGGSSARPLTPTEPKLQATRTPVASSTQVIDASKQGRSRSLVPSYFSSPARRVFREASLSKGSTMRRVAQRTVTPIPAVQRYKKRVAESDIFRRTIMASAVNLFTPIPLPLTPKPRAVPSLGSQAIAESIPETIAGAAIVGIGGPLLSRAAPAVRIASGVSSAGAGGITALDTSQPLPKRIAGGVAGALGIIGATSEAMPFIRGATARFRPGYKAITTEPVGTTPLETRLYPSGKARTIKGAGNDFDIRIIEPGKGFNFPLMEQQATIGTTQNLVTAQRGLPLQTSIFKAKSTRLQAPGKVQVGPGDEGLGLFFTPTPKGQPGALRESRLGLTELFKTTEQTGGQISYIQNRPQAVFLREVPVTRTGLKPGTVRGVGFISSELEVTLLATRATPGSSSPYGISGQVLKGRRVGSTVIKGQQVDIFKGQIAPATDITNIPGTRIPGTNIVSQIGGLNTRMLGSRPVGTFVSPSGLGGIAASSPVLTRKTGGVTGSLSTGLVGTPRYVSGALSPTPRGGSIVTRRTSISNPFSSITPVTRSTGSYSGISGASVILRTPSGPLRPPSGPLRPPSGPSSRPTTYSPRTKPLKYSPTTRPSYSVTSYRQRDLGTRDFFKPKLKAKLFPASKKFKYVDFAPRYTPSIKAITFDITGPKPKKREVLSGLFTRPKLKGYIYGKSKPQKKLKTKPKRRRSKK